MDTDFTHITELAGDDVTHEQVQRMSSRYSWAGTYCEGRDVLEVACGTGQGAGYLQRCARRYLAADYSWPMVREVREHYGKRIDVVRADACALPIQGETFDVVIAFEAIYYFSSLQGFIDECRRVLRVGGTVLIVTANKDLYDFNPSPHSVGYYGVSELRDALSGSGFSCEFYGDFAVDDVSLRQQITRPIKWLAVRMGLMPKSNETKKWLKKIIFGGLVEMPRELTDEDMLDNSITAVSGQSPDKVHKVLLCAATLEEHLNSRKQQ